MWAKTTAKKYPTSANKTVKHVLICNRFNPSARKQMSRTKGKKNLSFDCLLGFKEDLSVRKENVFF